MAKSAERARADQLCEDDFHVGTQREAEPLRAGRFGELDPAA